MAGAIRLICSPHCPSGWATPVAFSACIAGRRTYHRQGSCGREVPSVHWPELLMHFMWWRHRLPRAEDRQTDRQTALFMVDAGIRMFYLLSCTSMWTLWGTLSFLVGRDFHIRGSCAAVAVRPSWLPGCYLQSLLQSRAYLIFCRRDPKKFFKK